MTNAWEDWEEFPAECSCGWQGTLGTAVANYDSAYVTEIDCPQCSSRLKNISNSGTDELIKKIADAGGKKAKKYFVDQRRRNAVKTQLHDLGLELLKPSTMEKLPEVEGYETIPQAKFSQHPALQGLDSWVADFSPEDSVYAGYSLPVTSELDVEKISRLAFIHYDFKSGQWIEKTGHISTHSHGRSASWFSENSEQTRSSRPEVPVAFLLKKDNAGSTHIQIYSFTIQDKDPECLTFGCTASSLEEAQTKARKAGYREFLLMDVRNPSGVELSDVANLELMSNPLLGGEWLPLVSALEAATTDLPVGASWNMNFMGKAYGYNTSNSPYTQAIVEGDGSLHLEIGPPKMVEGRSYDQKQLLTFLGWKAPRDGLPNYFRIFEPGWNPRYVANVFLQTVSMIFEIGTEDLFTFSGTRVRQFDPEGLMDHLSEDNGRLAFGNAWGFWGKHPFPAKLIEQDQGSKNMLEPRLEKLIEELFVPDPRSIKLFGGEILESLDMDLAQAAVEAGKPIPASSYTKFDGFVRRLKADPERTTRLHNFDVYLSATLARLMDTRDTFFVGLWRADSAGGPYINFIKKADKYEVTLMSNYRKLEKREEWFAAALSLFEWYAADTGFLGVKLFRKSWSLDNDPVEIASAISLAVTYVLDALASGYSLIQIPRLQDEVLEGQYRKGQLGPVVDDASMGWRLISSANSKGFHPPVSQYRAGMDSLISQHNLRDAIDIAAENDDELGMYSLEQLLEDVQKREALFKPVTDKLREFVALSTTIRSIRLLPRDHPSYEDPDDYEDEDYEEEELTNPPVVSTAVEVPVPLPAPIPEPTVSPVTPDNLDFQLSPDLLLGGEHISSPDYTRINPGSSAELWALLKVFEGKVKPNKDNSYNGEFLLVSLLGSYLREITGFEKIHNPGLFAPAFDAREKINGPDTYEVILGVPQPTVLNHKGVYQGVIELMQQRAGRVFETLLKINSIEDHNARLMFINVLPDETLMDCKIWSMIKNKGNARLDHQRSILALINQLASLPTM